MTEQQIGVPAEAINAYKIGLKQESSHEIGGKNYLVQPIDKEKFYNSIYKDRLIGSDKNESLYDSGRFDSVVWRALFFTISNSKLFCGVSSKEFYKEDSEKEDIALDSIGELRDIVGILVKDKGEGINIPENMKRVFSEAELKKDVTVGDIVKGTRRGFETARLCHACEQVDPIVGGAVHATAGILSVINGSSGEFSEFWKNAYKGTIEELSSPKTTGFVDVMIKVVELNKDKFPNLDKFFGSHLKLDGFEGTYYDMVNIEEYK